jgi:hypothetical protein
MVLPPNTCSPQLMAGDSVENDVPSIDQNSDNRECAHQVLECLEAFGGDDESP